MMSYTNLYKEITFWTKKIWLYMTDDTLKDVQFTWKFKWQDKTRQNVTF